MIGDEEDTAGGGDPFQAIPPEPEPPPVERLDDSADPGSGLLRSTPGVVGGVIDVDRCRCSRDNSDPPAGDAVR